MDARGSIRKAPNVISWTSSFDKLRAAGDKDAATIIRAWNSESSKSHQIVGPKAQALKNVLGLMPANIFTTIVIAAVSELGWETCPRCDDTFSNKRIFPGAGPRASVDAWKTRLTVTEKSMGVMFQCQIGKQEDIMLTDVPRDSHMLG